MRPVIINTDPGHDDAMAIMLAVRSGMFDIRAITTVAGNSTIENTTRNARYILKILGRQEIPIYSGSAKPIKRELVQAVVHGKSGLEGIDPTDQPMLTGDAVDKMISIIRKSPKKVTLITLGPLTDIAKMLRRSPGITSMIKEIVMMGGAMRVPGNKNMVAEFNIFVDPEAADIVFKSPLKKTMVPLDACNRVSMVVSDFEEIADRPIRDTLLQMVKPYINRLSQEEGAKGALMYDPLTVYYLMNRGACKTNKYYVEVETKGKITRGMTVAELRNINRPKPNMTIVENITAKKFRKDFIRLLSNK